MEYKPPLETYGGKVREVVIGAGSKTVKIGGESILPFHYFEGSAPNRAVVALEVVDMAPKDWPDAIVEPYRDVVSDPVKWAKKCVEFGADMVFLRLSSTDPAGENASAEAAAATAKKVADAISVPLIVYGSENETKDVEVLMAVSRACAGQNVLIGPAVKENYEPIAKVALENGHCIIAQTPLDINLEKELNIKLARTFPLERIVIDPLSSALGYGMEYSFTIIERTKHVGVMFKDAMMQMPIIANLGVQCWKTREAKASKTTGLLWEAITAQTLLLAGANILVLRHPDNCKVMKKVMGHGAK